MQIKINGSMYNLLSSTGAKEYLKDFARDVITLKVEMTYQEAALAFTDGAAFTIIDDNEDQYEYTDYGVAGPITDNRDGTVTAKMGKNNTSEQDALEAQAVAQADAAKASEELVTLAGKAVNSDTDINALRLTFEAAAAKLSDADAKIAPSLTKAWTTNDAVVTGERRYYALDDNLYKALQDHTTSINTFPDTATDYWEKL